MKKTLLLFIAISTIVLPIVFAQKVVKRAVYTHNFPPEMIPDVKKAYTELFDRGKVLYEINCSKCHDSLSNGVLCMPAFTKEHLGQYELRIQNPEHEESLSETRVNAEELQKIMIFLTYYKRVEVKSRK